MSNSKIVQLGRYSFDRSIMIGSGSFGKVYCGNDSKTNQPVCIKGFQKKQEFGENVLETVNQKELDFTKQMINEQHENLVKIIDVCDNDNLGEAYIIMELCDQNMEEYVKKKKMLNREEIIDFISQVTNGYSQTKIRNFAIFYGDVCYLYRGSTSFSLILTMIYYNFYFTTERTVIIFILLVLRLKKGWIAIRMILNEGVNKAIISSNSCVVLEYKKSLIQFIIVVKIVTKNGFF